MDQDESFQIYLDIYKTYREETRASIQFQHNTLNWSSVAVGVILVFTLNLWKVSHYLTFGFFVLVFPSASLMFLNIWLMEVARMMRMGNYLLTVEKKLKKFLTDKSFSLYEHWLREKGHQEERQLIFGYKSGLAIYLGIVSFSYLIANIIYWFDEGETMELCHYTFGSRMAFTLFTALLVFCLIIRKYRQVKKYIL